MESSFLDKVNTYWNKGWKENPNYEKAKTYVNIVAKGKEEQNRDKETEKELEDISL